MIHSVGRSLPTLLALARRERLLPGKTVVGGAVSELWQLQCLSVYLHILAPPPLSPREPPQFPTSQSVFSVAILYQKVVAKPP